MCSILYPNELLCLLDMSLVLTNEIFSAWKFSTILKYTLFFRSDNQWCVYEIWMSFKIVVKTQWKIRELSFIQKLGQIPIHFVFIPCYYVAAPIWHPDVWEWVVSALGWKSILDWRKKEWRVLGQGSGFLSSERWKMLQVLS